MSVADRMNKVLEASGSAIAKSVTPSLAPKGKMSASDAYAAKRIVVDKRLREIEALLAKHAMEQAKKPLSFGYPGDLDYAIEQLDNLIEHLK